MEVELLKDFKMACLIYNASGVEHEGKVWRRPDLIRKKAFKVDQLLQGMFRKTYIIGNFYQESIGDGKEHMKSIYIDLKVQGILKVPDKLNTLQRDAQLECNFPSNKLIKLNRTSSQPNSLS